MKTWLSRLRDAAEWFDAEDPREPAYDPVHLGEVLIVTLVVIGALYWLLWTLFVYEGGLFSKLGALVSPGPRGPDAFTGWLANLTALGLCMAAVAALHRIYARAARRK